MSRSTGEAKSGIAEGRSRRPKEGNFHSGKSRQTTSEPFHLGGEIFVHATAPSAERQDVFR
jgi:hypothetical protein